MGLSIRDAFGKALVDLAKQDDRVVGLTADLTEATRMNYFAQEFPHRFFNFGVAEGNMMVAAAGMAAAGKIPFVSTFAVFASGRAWEPIRQSIGYPNLPVKIAATHAGLGAALEGAMHQMTEDIALMRALPNFAVICPADEIETAQSVEAAVEYAGPVYLRLGRETRPSVSPEGYRFRLGRGCLLRRGEDVLIVATGLMVHKALEAAQVLGQEGVSAGVINMASLKPLDEGLLVEEAARVKAVVTAEEHSVIGGLGAAVAQALLGKVQTRFAQVGMPDCYSESGDPELVREKFGLTSGEICRKARALLSGE